MNDSRQVAWWPVHEFLKALLAHANYGPLPWPGTPTWCRLADDDPRKLMALAKFGEHHSLRIETGQHAMADASRAISTAADWREVARDIQRRNDFHAEHPWAKRAVPC